MEFKDLLLGILEAILTATIPIVTTYIVKFFKCKLEQLVSQTDNARAKHYMDEATSAVTTAVTAVSQTYVDALKAGNAFTKEAQIEAFFRAKKTALSIISPAAAKFIEEAYGDFEKFIEAKIEETVYTQKNGSVILQSENVFPVSD